MTVLRLKECKSSEPCKHKVEETLENEKHRSLCSLTGYCPEQGDEI